MGDQFLVTWKICCFVNLAYFLNLQGNQKISIYVYINVLGVHLNFFSSWR
jgi:hypothetical protein